MEFYIPVTPTRPKPPRVWLLFLKKSGAGDNNFFELAHFGSTDRNKRTGESGQTFKASPKYCGRTEPKWSVPFDFYPKFPEFWTEWKGPRCDLQVTWVRVGPRYGFQKSELIDQISPFENKVTVFFFFFFSRFFLIPTCTLPILTCINSSDLAGYSFLIGVKFSLQLNQSGRSVLTNNPRPSQIKKMHLQFMLKCGR